MVGQVIPAVASLWRDPACAISEGGETCPTYYRIKDINQDYLFILDNEIRRDPLASFHLMGLGRKFPLAKICCIRYIFKL